MTADVCISGVYQPVSNQKNKMQHGKILTTEDAWFFLCSAFKKIMYFM